MDRNAKSAELAQVELDLVEGDMRIARQRAVIEDLQRDGLDATIARRALAWAARRSL
jgi:hypothetical protein